MARPGSRYPQVEPTAAALVDRRVLDCPARISASAALERARRAGADVVHLGRRRAARRVDLERLCRWGLGDRRAEAAAWHGLPEVEAGSPEIAARRLLMAGPPMLLVTQGRRVAGAIDGAVAPPALSLAHRLDQLESRPGEARVWLLRLAGKVGEGLGIPVFAVGGFVRDLLLGHGGPDTDLMVEGDGIRYARLLSDEIGGRVVAHPAFGTASIEEAMGPGGIPLGPIDIASARTERYDRAGALPVVAPASAMDDLRRRDFSVNAMAIALNPSAFGRLLDPMGGQPDLARRRLRPLSPLSFVEDPTRAFRGVRYAARIGFTLDPASVRALALALGVEGFPALSGERILAELELLAREPHRRRAFELLMRFRVVKLLDRDLHADRHTIARIGAADVLIDRARRSGTELDAAETFLTALLAGRPGPLVARCLERLGIRGERARNLACAAAARGLARRLGGRRMRPSGVAEALGPLPAQVLAGAWLHGGTRARRRVEWFLARGRAIRPQLSGTDVVALGVRPGPDVGRCLAALRRRRLDGGAGTIGAERRFVEQWRRGAAVARGGDGSRGSGIPKGGHR